MDSRTSFIPAQSAAPNLVNIVALESIVYGTRRRNIDKRNTIIQEDNLVCPNWNILGQDARLTLFYLYYLNYILSIQRNDGKLSWH